MVKVHDSLELYVGTKGEYAQADSADMSIVCAMNNGGNTSYQSVFGKTKPGDPNYLYGFAEDNKLFLNLVDAKDPKYIPKTLIRAALDFIDHELEKGRGVFIYCSMGESRSPSIALMYLMESDLISKDKSGIEDFYERYPRFNPGEGMKRFIYDNYIYKDTFL